DDEMLPHAIETLVGLRRRFPAARAAFADHTFRNLIDGTYWPNHHFHVPSFARMRAIPAIEDAGGARLYGPAMYYALLRGNILQQPWAIERATFAALGGFDADVRLCEDWEMYLRVCRSVPVAVSDRVIANHFVEPGKCHMSLAEGQADWHMKVLAKHERLTRWRDLRAWSIIQRRRGMYFKAAGDAQRLTNWPAAWRMYLRSWLAWPFDYVVAARCAAWAPAALRGRAASGSSSASGR